MFSLTNYSMLQFTTTEIQFTYLQRNLLLLGVKVIRPDVVCVCVCVCVEEYEIMYSTRSWVRSGSPYWTSPNHWLQREQGYGSLKRTTFPGFNSQNFTQLLLQSFSADLWPRPHPLINRFSIVTALHQWLSMQTKRHCQKWRPHKARRLFSKLIHAKQERNGPPRANQGLSTAK